MARWAEKEQRREADERRDFSGFLKRRFVMETQAAAIAVAIVGSALLGAGLGHAVTRQWPNIGVIGAASFIATAVAALAALAGILAKTQRGTWARHVVLPMMAGLGGFSLLILLRAY